MGVFIAPRTTSEQQFIDYINQGDIAIPEIAGLDALKNSDVFTGVNIIAGDIAKSMFRSVPDEKSNPEFIKMINKRPNKQQSHYTFFYSTIAQLILYGNAFALIHRERPNDYTSKIVALEFVESNQVNMIQDLVTGEWNYDVTMNYGSITYKCGPQDILHFKTSVIDGFIGRSPLLSLNNEIAMQSNGNKILSKFFSDGIIGGGILKLKKGFVDNATKRKVREDFEQANAGSTNSNSVIVLDESTDFQEYKMNTEILKLIQANKFSTQQIAKVLGIPLNRFGMELVNSTDTGQNDIYIASTISQYESAICDELEIKTGNTLEMDFSTLMNDTLEDRRKELFAGRLNKELISAISKNEVRAYYGYEPIEEGQQLVQPETLEKEVYNNDNEEPRSKTTTTGI
nr:MAG TPA: portal protein [Caudoviricetes sp.]